MWLILWHGSHAKVIASPKHDFNGFVLQIGPAAAHGYKDIVLGWHYGAGDVELNYMRFSGSSYRPVGAAEATRADDSDVWKIDQHP